jgi:glycosyltransferase involved in cell wall biosynthesis
MDVFLLYPGHYSALSGTKIIKNGDYGEVKVYELVNPLPVPLIFGIKKPQLFYTATDKTIYLKFLKDLRPDIIHVHTLMGIHKEFFEAAKELGIKTVYTTHDCFSLCPTSLIDYEDRLCDDFEDGEKCISCNANSYDISLIYFLQSRFFMKFKNIIMDNHIAQKYLDYRLDSDRGIKKRRSARIKNKGKRHPGLSNEYVKLRNYNFDILRMVDLFHFNSSLTKERYNRFLRCDGDVVAISHRDITDNRVKKDFGTPEDILRISYMGPTFVYRGFYVLVDSLNKLREAGIENWHLSVYGKYTNDGRVYDKRFYSFNGSYQYGELKNILNGTDVVVIPSFNDTFNFLGLEAISHGVPVIVSESAGIKDIVRKQNAGIIIEPNIEGISGALRVIIGDRQILKDINDRILKMDFKYDMDTHTVDIMELYKKAYGMAAKREHTLVERVQ